MYLVWDINIFVMYYVYGTSVPSLLIESTDSMILYVITALTVYEFKPLQNIKIQSAKVRKSLTLTTFNQDQVRYMSTN